MYFYENGFFSPVILLSSDYFLYVGVWGVSSSLSSYCWTCGKFSWILEAILFLSIKLLTWETIIGYLVVTPKFGVNVVSTIIFLHVMGSMKGDVGFENKFLLGNSLICIIK